jgi:hypothetical protein
MEVTDLEIAGELRGAANYLRTYGWRQDSLGQHGGSRCVVGAFLSTPDSLATFRSTVAMTEKIRDLAHALGFHWAEDEPTTQAVSVWNDGLTRTVDEVLDRLESTALALEVRALASEATFNDSVNVPESVNIAVAVAV